MIPLGCPKPLAYCQTQKGEGTIASLIVFTQTPALDGPRRRTLGGGRRSEGGREKKEGRGRRSEREDEGRRRGSGGEEEGGGGEEEGTRSLPEGRRRGGGREVEEHRSVDPLHFIIFIKQHQYNI